ncbi:ABC transporter ATP-binding protein [Dictyobacter kobayashii]|uniref:ABC transporter ATP-binding protein n=1 Tax=Dictyobacter kobayashii TaxID=2014872 RepID=A0A402AV92_9CHLR|nr:ABC transporter ATP-binding protein [Dictyobacter kobayashii]GCE23036.1 ABC transporter ATP-binding protein [Dictyobacter kobayashii]
MQTTNKIQAKIELQQISKSFMHGKKRIEVLKPLDMSVAPGEFISIVGPSGCGKSTLFNIIAGLEEASDGTIAIDGEIRRKRTGSIGYMPQRPALMPWRTVEENILLGPDVRRKPRQETQAQARELLLRFGLADFAHQYPSTLSGGMQQRVALLRTVLFHQEFLLLDEPFGALDALTRLKMQMWLLELWESFHSSVLFITHDVREALLLSDKIYVLSMRPATILRVVTVDLPRPRRSAHLAEPGAVRLEQELLGLLLGEESI